MNKQCWFAMLIVIVGFCINAEPTKAANDGADTAQFEVGKSHVNDNDANKSPAELAEWLRAEADQGHAKAQFYLGLSYAAGSGVEKNDVEAVKWYRKAADQGNIQAQYILATRYAYGLGVATNYLEAVELYRHVALHRFTKKEIVECHMALLFHMTEGSGKDKENGFLEKVNRAAELWGIPPARAVGDIYGKGGWGIEKSEPEAARWYRTAADGGDRYSMRALGDVYLCGRGVVKDVAEAIKWYHKAAEGGEKDAEGVKWGGEVEDPKWKAYYGLACCYLSGEGVDRDVLEAAKWWGKWFITCHTICFHTICFVLIVAFVEAVVLAIYKWRRKVAERRRRNAMCEKDGLKETPSQGEGNI